MHNNMPTNASQLDRDMSEWGLFIVTIVKMSGHGCFYASEETVDSSTVLVFLTLDKLP